MKGILLKDYYAVKSTFWMMLLILGVIGMMLMFIAPSILPLCAPTLFSIVLSMQVNYTIASDSASKWNRIAVTLPIQRGTMIAGKYLLYAASAFIGALLGIVLGFLGTFISNVQVSSTFISIAIAGFVLPIVAGTISIPLIYAFSKNEASWTICFVLSYLFIAVIFFIAYPKLGTIQASMLVWIMLALLFVSLGLFFLSFLIAKRIFDKQDL